MNSIPEFSSLSTGSQVQETSTQGSTGGKVLDCFLLLRLQSKEKPPFLNSITVSYHVTRACMHARSFQSCPTLCDPMDCSPPCSSVHGSFPGKNTGVGCNFLLQVIFLTQGSDPRLLHHRQVLHPLSLQGNTDNHKCLDDPFENLT